jgi:hypothetical protein
MTNKKSSEGLWVVWGFGWKTGGEFGDEELLEQVAGCGEDGADGGVLEDESGTTAIDGGVVEIGETCSSQASEEAGVVDLPAVVVALADDGVGAGSCLKTMGRTALPRIVLVRKVPYAAA